MRWEFALLVCLTACPGHPGGDDGVDASTNGPRLLRLAWSSKPTTIPDTTSSNVRIEDAYFGTQNLRVIGDAIGPGDLRTYVDKLPVEWGSSKIPKVSTFNDAPSGVYSRVVFEIDNDDGKHAFEIEGTANVEGTFEAFVIRDDAEHNFSVTVDPQVNLALKDDKTVLIQIDTTKITGTVDWKALPMREGKRVLDKDDPQMNDVRKKLSDAFSVDNSASQ